MQLSPFMVKKVVFVIFKLPLRVGILNNQEFFEIIDIHLRNVTVYYATPTQTNTLQLTRTWTGSSTKTF